MLIKRTTLVPHVSPSTGTGMHRFIALLVVLITLACSTTYARYPTVAPDDGRTKLCIVNHSIYPLAIYVAGNQTRIGSVRSGPNHSQLLRFQNESTSSIRLKVKATGTHFVAFSNSFSMKSEPTWTWVVENNLNYMKLQNGPFDYRGECG